MKINIDMEKYNILSEKISSIENEIEVKKKELDKVQKEILKIFPRGYWWAFDIDSNWKRPKKYSIKEVSNGYVTVKEVFKKAPWAGFDGKSVLSFNKLLELDIFKTEEEAKSAAYNRPCPKCGGPMKYTTREWCDICRSKRFNMAKEFESSHTFYCPEVGRIFRVGYTDELTRGSEKGFFGQHFTFQRVDTNEVINTDNLWSEGFYDTNERGLPEIKFLNNKVPDGAYLSDFFR